MSISMYQTSVPVLVRALNNLSGILAKGAAHAAERNIAPDVLLHTRITPDMFPLIQRLKIPVTLFIYPSAISNADYAMTWAQLAEMGIKVPDGYRAEMAMAGGW